MKYLIAQKEFTDGPEKKAHWQTYFETKNAIRRAQAITCLGLTSKDVHMEERKGTREQARAYCTRDKLPIEKRRSIDFKTPIVEIGEWIEAKRGTRNDLKEAVKLGNIETVRLNMPEVLIRYPQGIQRVFMDGTPRDSREPLHLDIIFGPTGAGKSLYAFHKYPDAYVKPRGEWWCGYTGEKVVIWDEFDPTQCHPRDFMQWFDRYPCKAPCKGGQANLRFKHAVITSHKNPRGWWAEKPGTISSRFAEIKRRVEEGGGHIWYTESEEWTDIIGPILEEKKAQKRVDLNEWVDEIFQPEWTLDDLLQQDKQVAIKEKTPDEVEKELLDLLSD